MTLAITALDVAIAAPFAFVLGFGCGLAGASRWRIVRRNKYRERHGR